MPHRSFTNSHTIVRTVFEVELVLVCALTLGFALDLEPRSVRVPRGPGTRVRATVM